MDHHKPDNLVHITQNNDPNDYYSQIKAMYNKESDKQYKTYLDVFRSGKDGTLCLVENDTVLASVPFNYSK